MTVPCGACGGEAQRVYAPGPWTGSTHTGIFQSAYFQAFDKRIDSRTDLRREMKEHGLSEGPPPKSDGPVRKAPTDAQIDDSYWSLKRSDVTRMKERREKAEHADRNGLTAQE